jgi:ATP-dependent exoDNAse (exonuclease V) beta subunit
MSFKSYEELPKLEAVTKTTGRLYHTPDGDFPSITTILGKTANNIWLQKWKNKVGEEEAARISKIATDRGTLVHDYQEKFWNNEDIMPQLCKENLDVIKMVNSLLSVSQKKITLVRAQEVAVWSPNLMCAGRVDKFCDWDGVPACLDYKTSKKMKSDTKDYKLQITFYIIAHNELFPTMPINKGIIMIAVENKDAPQIIEFDHRPFVPELKYRISDYYKNYHG